MGVHQRIDRVAHHHIKKRVPHGMHFPTTHDVLHFEGLNGPDGIKRKSPAKDEPWHYIDPHNPADRGLIVLINDHVHNLTVALRDQNIERAAFEAAWLAHAVVDGLTPAHHYPLEAKLEELRGGKGLETRTSTKEKLILPGNNRRHQLRNNWEYWGTKGVFTTHLSFELGIASSIASVSFEGTAPTDAEYAHVEEVGFETVFLEMMSDVARLDMYTEFTRQGWTRHMVRQARKELLPMIIRAVTLGWYQAIYNVEHGK